MRCAGEEGGSIVLALVRFIQIRSSLYLFKAVIILFIDIFCSISFWLFIYFLVM